VIPHALTFPGAFSEPGLLGAGPQSAAWLYLAWHSVLPFTVAAFALRRDREEGRMQGTEAMLRSGLAALGGVVAVTLLVTQGQNWLPPLVENGRFTTEARVAVGILLVLPLATLVLLIRRRRSILDLWLMVVMFAWFCTICLAAFVTSGRFDAGWYVGRVFDWMTSLFVLLVLLWETITLYGRQARAALMERQERERRLNEMEAVLIHLSRVSELGQNVSWLIHEVTQPLTAISNYASATIQMVRTSKPDRVEPLLERLAEQSARATEIIKHLRDFIARQDSDKRMGSISEVLHRAVALANDQAPKIGMKLSPNVESAFFDRVQIEQVAFNLIRNAIESMERTARRTLTLATDLNADAMVEVSVADTGPGLSPEIRSKLFEPFVTSKPSGLGIGLSICRVIVEAHGGQLRAENNPGGGTVFRFTLPLSPITIGAGRLVTPPRRP
jgi:signal transduction histidine kinase